MSSAQHHNTRDIGKKEGEMGRKAPAESQPMKENTKLAEMQEKKKKKSNESFQDAL